MSSSRDSYHHGDLAGALEDAALQLLVSKPAQDISLREVARAAGVSHNAPYHHFTDRLGLLRVLAERSMRDLLDAVEAGMGQSMTPAEALRDGGRAYIEFAVAQPHAFGAVYDPSVCKPGKPTPTMAPLNERLEALLFSAATAAGIDTDAGARAVLGLVYGLAMLSSVGHLTRDEATTAYEEALTRLLSQ